MGSVYAGADERCEYNPKFQRPSTDPPSEGDCPNRSAICLGHEGKWHVCESCAALPEFNKYRKRRPVKHVTRPPSHE